MCTCSCMFQLPSPTWNLSFQNPQDAAPPPLTTLPIIGMLRDALKTPLMCIYITLGTVIGASPNSLWLPKAPPGHLPYRAPCAQKISFMANPAICCPPPISTQLTVPVPTCIDVHALMRVSHHAFPAPVLLSMYLPVTECSCVIGHHVRIFLALDICLAK